MERDWATTLLPASWNGIPFHVESDGETAGSRLPTTDIPNGGWVTESFGRKRREYKVTAYVTADSIEAVGAALLAAAEVGRPGILVLPMAGFVQARLKEAKRNFRKDKLGYLGFDLDVQEEWSGESGLSVNAARSGIYTLTALVATPLASGFAARLSGAMGSPAARERVVEQAGAALERLAVLRDNARPTSDMRATVNAGLAAAARASASLVTAPAEFALAWLKVASTLGEVAEPATVLAAIAGETAPRAIWTPKWAATGAQNVRVDAAFALLQDAGRALAAVEAVTRQAFSARPEAVAARGIVSAVIFRARDLISGFEEDGGILLAQIDAAVASYLTVLAADLAPLVQVSAGAQLPALWWSWYLHATPDRAGEIAARAGAVHPSFLPPSFQTVAPDVRA